MSEHKDETCARLVVQALSPVRRAAMPLARLSGLKPLSVQAKGLPYLPRRNCGMPRGLWPSSAIYVVVQIWENYVALG
jgi:hypothetical protein